MHRLRVSLLILLVAALPAVIRGDSLDERVRAQMRWQRIPALSLAVMKNGKLIRSRGYGLANLETQTPARPESVYMIGSISKQFIAAAIAILIQDGKLKLDEPARKYITDAPEAWNGITIRSLLTHTSGLVREPPGFDPYKIRSDAEVIASAYAVPLRFPPASKFEYSNTGYYVLAEIIRRASGEDWQSFIAKRVFEPIGMSSTRPATLDIVPERARGYETRAGPLMNAEQWLAVRPSGAFLSTVIDFAKWDAALYTDTPLTAAMRKQMWTPPYGFGWFVDTVRGHRRLHHDGGLPGFVAEYQRFPDDGISVVIMANIGNRDLGDMAIDVAAHYVPTLRPPREPAIADANPDFTSRIRAFLRDLPKARFDEALFTPEAATYLKEDLSRGLHLRLREQGTLVTIELLEQKSEGEKRVYRYRVTYPHLTLFAVFTLDERNRIAAWSLTD